jgi:hypothetical protein
MIDSTRQAKEKPTGILNVDMSQTSFSLAAASIIDAGRSDETVEVLASNLEEKYSSKSNDLGDKSK